MTTSPALSPGVASEFAVGVGVRIVPAGLESHGDAWFVRAAVILAPAAVNAARASCGAPVDIRDWPQEIERLLTSADIDGLADSSASGLHAHFSPVKDETAVARPPGTTQPSTVGAFRAMLHDARRIRGKAIKRDEWKRQRSQDVGDIQTMWKRLIAPDSDDAPWKAIVAALRDSNSTLKSLRSNAPTPGAATIPDIRGIGRGQAALLLSLERGRSLLTRIRRGFDADGGCSARNNECNLAVEIAVDPPSALMAAERALFKNDPVGLAQAEKDARLKYEQMTKEDREQRDADLREDALDQQAKVEQRVQESVGKWWGALKLKGDRATRAAAYQALLECRSDAELNVAQCFMAVASESREKLTESMDASVHRQTSAAGQDRSDDTGRDEKEDKKNLKEKYETARKANAPQMRLSALQNQPSLARLFNLTVDVLIPLGKLGLFEVQAYKQRPGASGAVGFGFLAASLPGCGGTRRVWTTCKLRGVSPDLKTLKTVEDVWPCTRAELDLFSAFPGDDVSARDALFAQGALSQIDGYLNLSASRSQNGVVEPRFDIISLDALVAVENRVTQRSGARTSSPMNGPPLVTQRTAGLAVVDGWRQTAALVQAIKTLETPPADGHELIDADDLTVGYRMDVGVVLPEQPKKPQEIAWRSLCTRWVQFGDELNKVEPLLQNVVADPALRRAYDSAIVVMPAKINGDTDGSKTAYVEDIIGCWTGPPMGIDTHSKAIDLSGTDAVRLGILYSLTPFSKNPNEPWERFRIPRQVFGGGFHFRLPNRYLGGIVRKDSAGTSTPPGAAEADYSILPSLKNGARRYLRHERIEAPVITTPQPILARIFDQTADGIRETASAMFVRSKLKGASADAFEPYDDPKRPATSYRVVIPPSVSADFADRHRVFDPKLQLQRYRDCDGSHWSGPPDGLTGIDYDAQNGGFPTYSFSASSRGAIEAPTDPVSKPSGDSVFRLRDGKSDRRDPYYPDPAARYMVIAVRDLAGRLLPGNPLVVPVVAGNAYPGIRPIAIEITTSARRANEPRIQQRILGLHSTDPKRLLRGDECLTNKRLTPTTFYLNGEETIGAQGIAASRVAVALEPGESFELDIWCLPTEDDLARWFDAVESAALVASIDPQTGQACTTCETLALQLSRLGVEKIAEMARKLGRSRPAAYETICSSGQAGIPAVAPRCIARAAHDLLKRQPVPELAARSTITVTHAIPQPYAPPEIALKLTRATAAIAVENTNTQKKKAQTVAIGGVVKVDRTTTGLFEVVCEAVSLVTASFDDDQRRRRTPDEVARGIWPNSPVTDKPIAVSAIYGFDVKADGSVQLPLERKTLLRVDDDLPDTGASLSGLVPRDLDQLRGIVQMSGPAKTSQGGNLVRMNAPYSISDSRARILKLWAVAGARTANYFRDANGDISETAIACQTCPPQTHVLQAMEAPAKVAPLTILPAFHLRQTHVFKGTTHIFTVERRVRLRIRMRRPWFTSGEGERLGIVLWPPDILKDRIAGDKAARDYEVAKGESTEIAMAKFSDEDLGPGGRFVTRWGLDPIKDGGKLGWLTPPSAFPDLATACVDPMTGHDILPDEPVYVPRASVPVPVDDNATPRRQIRIEAALLTYVPKFDIDHETWFCDVEIKVNEAPEPFMRLGLVRYQPYAASELRVSEPVVEWLQVPQHRGVTVMVPADRPNHLLVDIDGNDYRENAAATSADSLSIEDWTKTSVMKITVLRQRDDGVETIARLDPQSALCAAGVSTRAERTWLPRSVREWNDYLVIAKNRTSNERPQTAVMPNDRSGDTMSWSAQFVLDEKPLAPAQRNTSYRVLIEEVQPMPPATFDDEPLPKKTGGNASEKEKNAEDERTSLVVSGPRFAALVDLGQPLRDGTADKAAAGQPTHKPKARRRRKITVFKRPAPHPAVESF